MAMEQRGSENTDDVFDLLKDRFAMQRGFTAFIVRCPQMPTRRVYTWYLKQGVKSEDLPEDAIALAKRQVERCLTTRLGCPDTCEVRKLSLLNPNELNSQFDTVLKGNHSSSRPSLWRRLSEKLPITKPNV